MWGHSTDTRALATSLAIEPTRDLVEYGYMCGRYTSTAAFEELALRFGITVDSGTNEDLIARYNVARGHAEIAQNESVAAFGKHGEGFTATPGRVRVMTEAGQKIHQEVTGLRFVVNDQDAMGQVASPAVAAEAVRSSFAVQLADHRAFDHHFPSRSLASSWRALPRRDTRRLHELALLIWGRGHQRRDRIDLYALGM